MKALEILKVGVGLMSKQVELNPLTREYINNEINFYNEAIKELEDLENRSCENCKYYRPSDYDLKEEILDQWVYCDMVYVETRDLCRLKNFCCNKWESK